jgi:uncharacterized membrane protein
MQLKSYRTIFISVCLIGIILFASPTIALLVKQPSETQSFSTIYLLGPNHTLEDIPFNIQAGVQYTVFLGVSNSMGESSYYTCNVKFRNNTESFPEKTSGKPSQLPTLYEYKQFIAAGKSWESPLTFKVNAVSIFDNKAVILTITINGIEYTVNKEAYLDTEKNGFYFALFIELWIYNPIQANVQFFNRTVSFPLKISQIA